MGLYIDASKIPSEFVRDYQRPMKAWLESIGTPFTPNTPRQTSQTLVYWQRSPWGENAAVAYSSQENLRLGGSGVFEVVFAVPTEVLKQFVKF